MRAATEKGIKEIADLCGPDGFALAAALDMMFVDLVALAHSYVGEPLRGSRRIGNLIESSNAVVGEVG